MYHFQEAITNTKGDALIGYFVKAVDPETGDLVSIYADQNSTPIISVSGQANAAKVDSDGMIDFYIVSGTYHIDIYATDGTTLLRRRKNIPMVDLGDIGSGENSPSLNMPRDLTLTIASGVLDIASTNSFFAISAETGTTDDLSTITSGTDGRVIVIRPLTGQTITLKSGGNFDITQDVVLSARHTATLIWDTGTTKWDVIAAPGASAVNTPTRTTLAALATVAGANAFLSESGREGTFVFMSGDQSAMVTADTAQGVYVPPATDTTGASGAWVRTNLTSLRPEWFGAVADGSTDCLAAWNAVISYIKGENRNNIGAYIGGREILFASAYYYFSDSLDIKQTLRIKGMGSGGSGGLPTKLRWPASKAGFRIQRYDTTGENGAGTGTTGGDGTIIEGFYLEGGGGTANILKSGIWLRARAFVRDCRIAGFAGAGTLVYASVGGSGAAYGNANGWEISRVRLEGNKSGGHYCTGSDANAGKGELFDIANCAQYGLFDTCFLANTYIGCQVASCGTGGSASLAQTSNVSDGTYRYQLVHGQDANAASTAPTTGADNAVWKLQGTGAVAGTIIPLYSTYVGTGGSFVSGGSYYLSNANAQHILSGCYHESGQADPWIDAPAMAIGGVLGSLRNRGTGTMLCGSNGGLQSQTSAGVRATSIASVVRNYQKGELNSTFTIDLTSHTTYAPNNWRVAFGANAGANYPQDIVTSYNNTPVERLTGPSTGEQFGTGAAVSLVRHVSSFALGPFNNAGARQLTYGSAAPTTGAHALGEIVFNNGLATAVSTTSYWQCTTAGTPGTWNAHA